MSLGSIASPRSRQLTIRSLLAAPREALLFLYLVWPRPTRSSASAAPVTATLDSVTTYEPTNDDEYGSLQQTECSSSQDLVQSPSLKTQRIGTSRRAGRPYPDSSTKQILQKGSNTWRTKPIKKTKAAASSTTDLLLTGPKSMEEIFQGRIGDLQKGFELEPAKARRVQSASRKLQNHKERKAARNGLMKDKGLSFNKFS